MGVAGVASKAGVQAWGKISPENRRYQSALKAKDSLNSKTQSFKSDSGNSYNFKRFNDNNDKKKEK